MKSATNYNSSLPSISTHVSMCLNFISQRFVESPVVETFCFIPSISWVGRAGLSCACTVKEDLLPVQGRPERPGQSVMCQYEEEAVIRTIQFEHLPKKILIFEESLFQTNYRLSHAHQPSALVFSLTPPDILTENIWFVWSETSYSGDERCHGTTNHPTNSEDRATQPMEAGG